MPSQFSHINLIQTKAKGSARLAAIEQSLHKSAVISLIIFVSLGVIAGGIFAYYTFRKQSLEPRKKLYVTQINAAKNKEGLLLSIKDRTKIVSNVLFVQRPWASVLDIVSSVVSLNSLSNLSADEQNKFSVSFSAQSLDEVLIPIKQLITFGESGTIKNPELVSVQFSKDGTVDITIAFVAAFK